MSFLLFIKIFPYVLLFLTFVLLFWFKKKVTSIQDENRDLKKELEALRILNREYLGSIERAKKYARAGQTVYSGLNDDLLNIEDIVKNAKEKTSDVNIWAVIDNFTQR